MIQAQGSDVPVVPGKNCGTVVYVVEERANPSSDYFVLPALRAAGCRVVRCGFEDLPARHELDGAAVVFVRYVPGAWARLVAGARAELTHLVFFMDDDVLDVRASAGLPWRYRIKLLRLGARWHAWLRQQRAELWVSTPWLQQKYASWHPRVVFPAPLSQSREACRVFYHGSASHAAEVRWLRPVLAEATRRDSRLVVEIIGGEQVRRMYRGLPRVNVVHPMTWPAYQDFLTLPGRRIGLAPLLDVPFNRARACTKFFDITRCGAVGIYSAEGVCSQVVSDGLDGLLLHTEPSAWVDGILKLASEESLLPSMLQRAREKQALLGAAAQSANCGLLG